MKRSIKRNILSIIVGIVCGVSSWGLKINVSDIHNYTDSLNGLLTLSGFSTAIVFSSYSLIPFFSELLKELGTHIKFRDRLLDITIMFFILCSLTLVGLFSFDGDTNTKVSAIYISILIGFSAGTFMMMINLFVLMLNLQKNDKNP